MDLSNFKFLPQKNRQKGAITIEDFLQAKVEPVINWSIKRDIAKTTIFFKKANFLFQDDWGYTAAIDTNNDLFLFRTKVENENPLLEPKFLIGADATPFTKSNYLDFMFELAFPGETLFQTEIVSDNQWKIVKAKVETPAIEERKADAFAILPVADIVDYKPTLTEVIPAFVTKTGTSEIDLSNIDLNASKIFSEPQSISQFL
jgi:hypothetical protein